MWSSRLVVFLVVVLLLLVAAAGGAPPPPPVDAAATASVHDHQRQANKQKQGHGHGHGGGGGSTTTAVDRNNNAFYEKVGKFAVMVHCMWSDIKPVPKLERVLSASTRPAKGGGGGAVEYLLVLRVARLGKCRALVWGVPAEGSQDWKLKYFEPVNGGA